MKSRTKNLITNQKIEELVKLHFGQHCEIAQIQELEGGMFSAVYLIERKGEMDKLVLKIGPAPEAPLLTYEKNVMSTEVECLRIIREQTSIPVPEVLACDFSRTVLNSNYFFMDNLNTHSIASLYKAFEPAQARRIVQRLEIHYTPIHASWLNMAEIEIGILSRQCLSQSLSSFEDMKCQVNSWVLNRNSVCSTVRWRFSSEDARCKLRKLYPVIF